MIACLSQATILNSSYENDLEACARAGWPAIEIWLTKLEQALERPGAKLRSLDPAQFDLKPLAASMQGGLFGVPEAERPTHRDHFRRRLEWLQALAIPTLVIVPSFTARPSDSDLSRAADNLAEAASTAAPFGVRLALEFQKTAAFCASLDTAIALVEHASQPNLGVCLDLFHYYTGPSKFEDLGYLRPRNLAHVQVCDLSGTPRELASDTDRVLPGDGDFQIAPILDHLRSLGYEAGVSVEVNNPALWQIPADRVAEVALRALERFVQLPTSSDDGGA